MLTSIAALVPTSKMERLVHVPHKVDQEPQGNVPASLAASLMLAMDSLPLARHDSRRLIHDPRQHVDIFVHPSMFAILAVIRRVIRLGYTGRQ